MDADTGSGSRARSDPNASLISIVVPLFGPEQFLTACIKSIREHTDRYELVIVDNGTGYSVDANIIIRNPENLGFAVASNQGADAASAEIVCFLNVDTEVQPNWLPPLLAAFEESTVAMVGPRIVRPDGSLQTCGIRTWHGNGSAGGEEMREELPTRDVDGVTGACALVRKDVFNQMGQFSTQFRNGYEDVALCLSIREAGYCIRFVAESTIVHHESAAGGADRWAHAHQNIDTMNRIWGNR